MYETLGIALAFAGVTVTCVSMLYVSGSRRADALDRAARAEVRVADLLGQLTIAKANISTESKRADTEGRRADGLYDVLQKLRTHIGSGADGRELVLRLWESDHEATNPAASPSAGAVHPGAATKEPGPDDLIKPE